MKYNLFTTLVFLALPFSLLSQVSVDEELISNSETMKQKYVFTMSSGNVMKTALGPFRITDIQKGKKHFSGKKTEDYLVLQGKQASVKRSVSKISTQPFTLYILQDGADSIISIMDLIMVKGGNHAIIESYSGTAKEEKNSDSYCLSMSIQVKSDSLAWHLSPRNDQPIEYNDFPVFYDGVLTDGTEKILIKGTDDFPSRGKGFLKPITDGVVFIYNKKQVAALRIRMNPGVWFSNNISERHRKVIAAAMLSWLSIRQKTP